MKHKQENLYASIDSVAQEIKIDFDNFLLLSHKYGFLASTNIVNASLNLKSQKRMIVTLESRHGKKKTEGFFEEESWKEGILPLFG